MPLFDWIHTYRRPLPVTDSLRRGGYDYPICPRCRISLDREYMAYCDRCGQKLQWDSYHTGKAYPAAADF